MTATDTRVATLAQHAEQRREARRQALLAEQDARQRAWEQALIAVISDAVLAYAEMDRYRLLAVPYHAARVRFEAAMAQASALRAEGPTRRTAPRVVVHERGGAA